MKRIMLFLTILLTVAVVYAQNDAHRGPEIKFSKTIHNYDTIAKGSDGECWFEFENTGPFTKVIVVKSNAATNKKAILRIKGVVKE